MRVTLHLSKFYDWVRVPDDVTLTREDIAGPLIMPDRIPGKYRMRVEKDGPTHRDCHIAESTIVAKIIDEKVDVRRSGMTLTRKQAVAHVLRLLLDGHAQWSWITSVDVHDDGPDEALARAMLEPHTTAVHGRRGHLHMQPGELDEHLKAYVEPADHRAHADYLHAHFGVPAKTKEVSQ